MTGKDWKKVGINGETEEKLPRIMRESDGVCHRRKLEKNEDNSKVLVLKEGIQSLTSGWMARS